MLRQTYAPMKKYDLTNYIRTTFETLEYYGHQSEDVNAHKMNKPLKRRSK
ncbi:MAG: hypothetical protein ACK6AT_02925 [Planctomycetota bacterium]